MSENYIPLYRKYRPQKLEEIVGQEHIKKALANAISLGRISHAYLFTGPRGTGKTSTARILAKSLNCINGPTVNPCGECTSCNDITNTVPIDVIEIDAASNRKVEDAQNILEKIQYVPVNGKYKIYIIDEVHMLSNTAFNALLKTLEEPPKNVIFILATTESHKVLDTIKSRCQRFDFRRITSEDITKHLRYISDKEGIKISDAALYSIAKNSAGGMRDSIALLDQVSILGDSKEITEQDIDNILGRLSFDTLNKMAETIINSDSIEAIKLLESTYSAGNEPVQILTNLMYYFKNLLIAKNCEDSITVELTGVNSSQIKILNEQKQNVETHQIVFLIEKIAYYIKEIKTTTNQQMWAEVAFIDLANLTNNTKLVELQSRLQALEGGSVVTAKPREISMPKKVITTHAKPAIEKPVAQVTKPQEIKAEEVKGVNTEGVKEIVSNPKIEKDTTKQKPIESEPISEPQEEFAPMPKSKIINPSEDIRSLWSSLLSNITSKSAQAILKLANPVKIAPEEVIITFKQPIFVKQANEGTKKQAIIEAADILFDQENTIVTIRTPMDSDVVMEKTSTPKPTLVKSSEEKKNLIQKPQISDEEIEEVEEIKKEETKSKQAKKTEEIDEINELESEQSKMIKDLFDGKYIH